MCVCVYDVIQGLSPRFLSGQAGHCCGPWEKSSGEQVNMSEAFSSLGLSVSPTHVPFSHLVHAKTL